MSKDPLLNAIRGSSARLSANRRSPSSKPWLPVEHCVCVWKSTLPLLAQAVRKIYSIYSTQWRWHVRIAPRTSEQFLPFLFCELHAFANVRKCEEHMVNYVLQWLLWVHSWKSSLAGVATLYPLSSMVWSKPFLSFPSPRRCVMMPTSRVISCRFTSTCSTTIRMLSVEERSGLRGLPMENAFSY